MPDKQANIHNADETGFSLNNMLTEIVFAEKGIKRDNHIYTWWNFYIYDMQKCE
jgi:hypothetical protein